MLKQLMVIAETTDFCGETPVFLEEENSIYWIDTGNPIVYKYDLLTSVHSSINTVKPLEGLVPRKQGGWVAPSKNSILLYDQNFKLENELENILTGAPGLAFHDCCAGSEGSLYLGAYLEDNYQAAEGCVFRLSAGFKLDTVISGLALPNGSGFSPDGRRFYLNEMMASRILSFNYSADDGSFSNKTTLAAIDPADGYPDGLCVDASGNLWIAMWQGSSLIKYSPEGEILSRVRAPVPSPTCPAFGGRSNEDLFLTSARKGLSENQLTDYPESGNLFVLEKAGKGLELNTFAG